MNMCPAIEEVLGERALARVPRRRVLVVDDDRQIRETIGDILREEGYEVDSAENGAAALAAIRRERPPDLMLLDLMMPVISGLQLLDLMDRDATRLGGIPVVVITAFSLEAPRNRSVKKCLTKPIDVDSLLDAVRTWSGWPPTSAPKAMA